MIIKSDKGISYQLYDGTESDIQSNGRIPFIHFIDLNKTIYVDELDKTDQELGLEKNTAFVYLRELIRKRADEAKKREAEDKRRADEAKKREAEDKRRADEDKRREAEDKRRADEDKRREAKEKKRAHHQKLEKNTFNEKITAVVKRSNIGFQDQKQLTKILNYMESLKKKIEDSEQAKKEKIKTSKTKSSNNVAESTANSVITPDATASGSAGPSSNSNFDSKGSNDAEKKSKSGSENVSGSTGLSGGKTTQSNVTELQIEPGLSGLLQSIIQSTKKYQNEESKTATALTVAASSSLSSSSFSSSSSSSSFSSSSSSSSATAIATAIATATATTLTVSAPSSSPSAAAGSAANSEATSILDFFNTELRDVFVIVPSKAPVRYRANQFLEETANDHWHSDAYLVKTSFVQSVFEALKKEKECWLYRKIIVGLYQLLQFLNGPESQENDDFCTPGFNHYPIDPWTAQAIIKAVCLAVVEFKQISNSVSAGTQSRSKVIQKSQLYNEMKEVFRYAPNSNNTNSPRVAFGLLFDGYSQITAATLTDSLDEITASIQSSSFYDRESNQFSETDFNSASTMLWNFVGQAIKQFDVNEALEHLRAHPDMSSITLDKKTYLFTHLEKKHSVFRAITVDDFKSCLQVQKSQVLEYFYKCRKENKPFIGEPSPRTAADKQEAISVIFSQCFSQDLSIDDDTKGSTNNQQQKQQKQQQQQQKQQQKQQKQQKQQQLETIAMDSLPYIKIALLPTSATQIFRIDEPIISPDNAFSKNQMMVEYACLTYLEKLDTRKLGDSVTQELLSRYSLSTSEFTCFEKAAAGEDLAFYTKGAKERKSLSFTAPAYLLESKGGNVKEVGEVGFNSQQFQSLVENLFSLHLRGVVHGDVKCSNLVYKSGESEVTLIDFGLSHLIGAVKAIPDTRFTQDFTQDFDQFYNEYWKDYYLEGWTTKYASSFVLKVLYARYLDDYISALRSFIPKKEGLVEMSYLEGIRDDKTNCSSARALAATLLEVDPPNLRNYTQIQQNLQQYLTTLPRVEAFIHRYEAVKQEMDKKKEDEKKAEETKSK